MRRADLVTTAAALAVCAALGGLAAADAGGAYAAARQSDCSRDGLAWQYLGDRCVASPITHLITHPATQPQSASSSPRELAHPPRQETAHHAPAHHP